MTPCTVSAVSQDQPGQRCLRKRFITEALASDITAAMNGTPPKPPQSAEKWRKKRDEARQKKQDLDRDVATATTVPLKNVFATLAPSTAERIKRMQAKAAPFAHLFPPDRLVSQLANDAGRCLPRTVSLACGRFAVLGRC